MSVLDLQAMVPDARDRQPSGSRASKGCFNTGGGGGGGGDNISSLSVALCAK